MEGFLHGRSGGCSGACSVAGRHTPLPVRTIRQRVQQLPAILEVTTPQQAHTLACETIGGVSVQAVIGDLHLLWR
jgi:hypothetical protein